MELMKLEVLIAGTVYVWRALVGERVMNSRIITERKTQCLCSALICRESRVRAIPSASGEHNPCLYPGMARPGLANANGLPLQQHNIQNSNLKYETYIRIISSSKMCSDQAGENYS